MKNFALLGKWHVHAPDYAKQINALPGCRIARIWDAIPEQAAAWAEELGCVNSTVEEILQDPEIEGVIICNATNEHADLMIRACNAGKALFTEKVLTLTEAESLQVKAAIEANNTRFAISFPHHCMPATQFSLEYAAAGKLGKLNYARVHNAHNGALANWLPPHFYDPIACGGGAMIDLGAHPMYLLCAILGEPVCVRSTFTNVTGRAVEDNAVSVLEFENGAIGVSETAFVGNAYPFTLEIGGSEGTLLQHNSSVRYCSAETQGKWVDLETLPEARQMPIVQWALADKPEEISADWNIDAAVRLTRVMEAAYRK